MRDLLVMLIAIMFTGCTTNLAWRGVVINTLQEATTEGKISNRPTNGDNSVAADKQFDADVPFSGSGSVNNAPTGGAENKTGGNAATNTGGTISTSATSNAVSEAKEPVTDVKEVVVPVDNKTE